MKRLFIFGDAHSYGSKLEKALFGKGYNPANPNHILISLGDICDRGDESVKILEFINLVPEDRKICVVGNHELLMEKMIKRGEFLSHDVHNCTLKTAEELTGLKEDAAVRDMNNCYLWNKYKNDWVWYCEIGNMIFVHGWIPCNIVHTKTGLVLETTYIKDWRNSGPVAWENATWLNGMRAWNEGVDEPGKTIFCGHWHTSWGHANLHGYGKEFLEKVETYHTMEDGTVWPFVCYEPFEDKGIVAVDARTAVSGKVNVVVRDVEDEVFEKRIIKKY